MSSLELKSWIRQTNDSGSVWGIGPWDISQQNDLIVRIWNVFFFRMWFRMHCIQSRPGRDRDSRLPRKHSEIIDIFDDFDILKSIISIISKYFRYFENGLWENLDHLEMVSRLSIISIFSREMYFQTHKKTQCNRSITVTRPITKMLHFLFFFLEANRFWWSWPIWWGRCQTKPLGFSICLIFSCFFLFFSPKTTAIITPKKLL